MPYPSTPTTFALVLELELNLVLELELASPTAPAPILPNGPTLEHGTVGIGHRADPTPRARIPFGQSGASPGGPSRTAVRTSSFLAHPSSFRRHAPTHPSSQPKP